MNLEELEELINCNELDILYKIIDKCQTNIRRAEEVVKNNKTAAVDVRRTMQDIRLMSEIIRDEIQIRHSGKTESKLKKAIENEKKRLEKEEELIKKLEKKRLEN